MRFRDQLLHGVDPGSDDYQTLCGLPLPLAGDGTQGRAGPYLDRLSCPGCRQEVEAREVERVLASDPFDTDYPNPILAMM